MTKEIFICPQKLTGKQAFKLVDVAIKQRAKALSGTFTQKNFLEVSGLSRAQLNRYRLGEKPGVDGAYKLARGLQKWGHVVHFTVA